MKKLLLAALVSSSILTANAQHVDVGLHGGYGTTWLINNNVSDQGPELDAQVSFGSVFGVHAGYYTASRVGVVMEINRAVVNQKYKGESGAFNYEINDKLTFIEVPLLLRKYSKGGFYFEIGPKFSFLNNAREDFTNSPANPLDPDYKDLNVKAGYSKTIISAAFGIGGQFEIAKNIYADVRLRFAYGFSDATKKFSEIELLTMSEDISYGSGYAHFKQNGDYAYKKTNMATGHVMAGITYKIPMVKKPVSVKKK